MFLSVSEFTGALKSRGYYMEKYLETTALIDELTNAREKSLKNIDSEQYYHIRTSLNYETVIDKNGEEIRVLKPRTTNDKSEIDIIVSYDKRRESTKQFYENKINELSKTADVYSSKIAEINEVLEKMPTEIRNASINIFVDGLSYKDVASVLNMSGSTLYRIIQKEIENAGGKVVGSVSKKTNYLINNDVESGSSKNVKAKELGIPIITEEQFKEML